MFSIIFLLELLLMRACMSTFVRAVILEFETDEPSSTTETNHIRTLITWREIIAIYRMCATEYSRTVESSLC